MVWSESDGGTGIRDWVEFPELTGETGGISVGVGWGMAIGTDWTGKGC
jgi:hypothetical protein